MGRTYKIAELLKTSFSEAKKYCEEVRSISGLGSNLSYKTIAYHLAQHPAEVLSPEDMARIVKKYPAVIQPVQPAKQKKSKQVPLRKPKRWNIAKAVSKERRYTSQLDKPASPAPVSSYAVRTSYFDHIRVSEQELEHCPHGVSRLKTCAICDPEKFREMTGMD
jgi:hypothetical protein